MIWLCNTKVSEGTQPVVASIMPVTCWWITEPKVSWLRTFVRYNVQSDADASCFCSHQWCKKIRQWIISNVINSSMKLSRQISNVSDSITFSTKPDLNKFPSKKCGQSYPTPKPGGYLGRSDVTIGKNIVWILITGILLHCPVCNFIWPPLSVI